MFFGQIQRPVFAMLALKITAISFRSQKRIITGMVNELVAKFDCIILWFQIWVYYNQCVCVYIGMIPTDFLVSAVAWNLSVQFVLWNWMPCPRELSLYILVLWNFVPLSKKNLLLIFIQIYNAIQSKDFGCQPVIIIDCHLYCNEVRLEHPNL